MPYNGYNESRKNSALKYVREKMKVINLRFPKDRFEQDIEPYIKESGLPTATFIKAAIKEKIERDYFGNAPGELRTDTGIATKVNGGDAG